MHRNLRGRRLLSGRRHGWANALLAVASATLLLQPTATAATARAPHPARPAAGHGGELAAGSAITRHEILSLLRPGTGLCAGLFQSRAVDDAPCTHGPDTLLPDPHGHVGIPPGLRARSLPEFDDLPGIPCYSSGPRVHVFYAYFEKNLLDAPGLKNRRAAILNAVAVADRILSVSASQSGGVRHIRWVMSQCHLTITPFRVAQKWTFEAFDPTYLRAHLERAGLMSKSEKGLTFLETETAPIPAGCQGVGEVYPDDRTTPANLNNHGDMNTLVVTGCADALFDPFAMGEVSIHELFHSMGAVQQSAPHHTNNRHCWDESDVMCYDDDFRPKTFPLRKICPATVPELLDCNDNDYFDTNPPGGSYLATHWDAARNTFQATTAPPRYQPLPTPLIALKSPGSVVSGTVKVPLTVRSQGGGITEVDFTVDGRKTVDRAAPYAVTVNTLGRPNGARITIGALAIDRFGRQGTAKQLALTVRNPTATLLTPASFQPIGQRFSWSATASAAPGHTIQKVELLAAYNDGKTSVIDTDATAPFGGTVTALPRPSIFAGTLRVRATQSGGTAVTSSGRDVVLSPPLVTNVMGPAFGVGSRPVTFLTQVGASPGLSVSSLHVRVIPGFDDTGQPVDQFDVRTPIATRGPDAWFAASWPRPGGFQPVATKTYTLAFTAIDSAGSASGFAYPATVSWLAGSHSSVGISEPSAGATVGGAHVTIAADPDLNGAQAFNGQIDVDLGGADFPIDGTTTPAWTIPNDSQPGGWNTTQVANGPHLLQADVFTNENLGDAPSPGRIVTVDNADPRIVVGGVSAGDHVTGSVHLHAALSGLPGGWPAPVEVVFYANGRSVDEDTSPAPQAADGTWSTAPYDDGRVEVRAVAIFFGQGTASWRLWSAPVVVTVHH